MQVTHGKFLAVYIDENLLWKYINYIELILTRIIGVISKILYLLDSKPVKNFYIYICVIIHDNVTYDCILCIGLFINKTQI